MAAPRRSQSRGGAPSLVGPLAPRETRAAPAPRSPATPDSEGLGHAGHADDPRRASLDGIGALASPRVGEGLDRDRPRAEAHASDARRARRRGRPEAGLRLAHAEADGRRVADPRADA